MQSQPTLADCCSIFLRTTIGSSAVLALQQIGFWSLTTHITQQVRETGFMKYEGARCHSNCTWHQECDIQVSILNHKISRSICRNSSTIEFYCRKSLTVEVALYMVKHLGYFNHILVASVTCLLCMWYTTNFKGGYQSHSESECSQEASPFVKLVSPFRMLIAFLMRLVFFFLILHICPWRSALVAWVW